MQCYVSTSSLSLQVCYNIYVGHILLHYTSLTRPLADVKPMSNDLVNKMLWHYMFSLSTSLLWPQCCSYFVHHTSLTRPLADVKPMSNDIVNTMNLVYVFSLYEYAMISMLTMFCGITQA